jgi:hypothetical protein
VSSQSQRAVLLPIGDRHHRALLGESTEIHCGHLEGCEAESDPSFPRCWVPSHLRIFEFTDAAEFLTLNASWVVRITLDLLLTTGHASDRQSLSRLPCLCHAPVGVDSFTVNDSLAMGPIIIKVAKTLARNLRRAHEPGEKVGSCPNLRAQSILRGRKSIRHSRARRRRWRVVRC